MTTIPTTAPLPQQGAVAGGDDLVNRISAKFGLAFAVCQLAVMLGMTILVLPNGGSPDDPAVQRGHGVLKAATSYRVGNFLFIVAGMLLLGFLGVVQHRLRRVDRTGTLASIAVVSGALLALIWPLAAVLHDVALDTAASGADIRILAAWDSVAPYSLAFSALPRVFFIGAIVIGLRLAEMSPRLRRVGIGLIPLSLLGSATLLSDGFFPLLALSTLGYELWVGALAVHWLRQPVNAAGRDPERL